MIKYHFNKKVDFEKLIILFSEGVWGDKTKEINRLKDMVNNSQIVVTAWDDEEMVGFGRCVTDFVFNGQINNVVVHSDYRRRGIGKELIKIILESSKQVTYILRGDPENKDFYERLGFEEAPLSFVYRRKI